MSYLFSFELTIFSVRKKFIIYTFTYFSRISKVYFPVFRFICQQHKVFKSVIRSISVNVMNNFFFKKFSSNRLFHYKPMLSNIHINSVRVFRAVFEDISMLLLYNGYSSFVRAFFRAVFTSTRFYPMRLNHEFFTTTLANCFNACRVSLTHARPRTSDLFSIGSNEFLFTNRARFFNLTWHNFFLPGGELFLSLHNKVILRRGKYNYGI